MSLLPWLFTAILCFAEPLAARSAHAIQLEPEPISEESPFEVAGRRKCGRGRKPKKLLTCSGQIVGCCEQFTAGWRASIWEGETR
jgi:hypothetical protein